MIWLQPSILAMMIPQWGQLCSLRSRFKYRNGTIGWLCSSYRWKMSGWWIKMVCISVTDSFACWHLGQVGDFPSPICTVTHRIKQPRQNYCLIAHRWVNIGQTTGSIVSQQLRHFTILCTSELDLQIVSQHLWIHFFAHCWKSPPIIYSLSTPLILIYIRY